MRYLLGLVLLSCVGTATSLAVEPTSSSKPPAVVRSPSSTQQKAPAFQQPIAGSKKRPGNDFLEQARRMNAAEHPVPARDSRDGNVQPLEFDDAAITKTSRGFTIQMPSNSPVPTPAIHNGRLYLSGGFSSSEFYCFDAQTGRFLWGAQLDDDGPSTAVLDDESIILNTESCTIFVLNARTGKLKWAHWLGDPLMSVPTVAHGRVFTTYPVADAPAVDDASDDRKGKRTTASILPTHALVCFDEKTGETLWQRWIDTECLSAPVAVDNMLYVTTYSGTLYEFKQSDGQILAARQLKATSAPVVAGAYLYYSRRTDTGSPGHAVSEAIARIDRATGLEKYLAGGHDAPYLDWRVQAKSHSVSAASGFEAKNGIMGGMGGGMGGSGVGGSAGGSGFFDVADNPTAKQTAPPNKAGTQTAATKVQTTKPVEQEPDSLELANESLEPLAITERTAAQLIGQGNVSTLQSYHGSRVLPIGDRNVICMGDAVVCLSAESGKLLWSLPLKGDLTKEGGTLAAPPVLAGKHVLISTLEGSVLEIDPQLGKIVETYKIGAPLRFPPAVVQGWIYASTQDGKLVAVDTGKPELTGWNMWFRDAQHSNAGTSRR